MMRNKWMSSGQFTAIQEHDWSPVELDISAWPDWMNNMKTLGLVNSVFASGSSASAVLWFDPNGNVSEIYGAIKTFRNSPDDPVPFNVDTYVVTSNPSGMTVLGPYKDGGKSGDHWSDQIPTSFSGILLVKR